MWMLDTGTLDRLSRVNASRQSTWVWPHALLHTTEAIISESRNNARIPALLGLRASDGAPCIHQHEILLGSDAAAALAHLRPNATLADKNYGEDSCIALCATTCPELTFVSNDKRAAWRALFELGRGRVACELDCWEWLRDNRHIDASDFDRLYRSTLNDLQFRPEPWRYRQTS